MYMRKVTVGLLSLVATNWRILSRFPHHEVTRSIATLHGMLVHRRLPPVFRQIQHGARQATNNLIGLFLAITLAITSFKFRLAHKCR